MWPLETQHERVGEIRNILKHKIVLLHHSGGVYSEVEVEHLVIELWWYKTHPQSGYF